jgi:FkbM family methyltransferase
MSSAAANIATTPKLDDTMLAANGAAAGRLATSFDKLSSHVPKQSSEILDAVKALGTKVDGLLRRIDLLTAQIDTVRRSQSVYLGDHIACTYLQNGWRIFVDTRSFDVGIHLLMGGAWETMHSKVFERMLFRGAGVIDVGANMGFYSVLAGPHIGPEGLLVSIEANPRLARLVHYSLAINGLLRGGEVHNVAAASAPGVVDLVADPYMMGGGSVRPHSTKITHQEASSTQTYRVPAVPIDHLLGDRRKRINVIKMDIEGAEPAAFEGMKLLLKEARPLRILLEYNGHAKHIADAFKVLQPYLEEQGFHPLAVVNEAQLSRMTWDELIASGQRQDVVIARHDDHGWITVV